MSAAENTVSAQAARLLLGFFQDIPVLLLAVSGGPDSTALLWLAARWRKSLKRGPKLIAVTIDHGLRSESAREAKAVARLARNLGVAHRTLRWTGKKPKTGLQEAARQARYRLLAGAARQAGTSYVLTAHTLDDQAETVLFRLARGSGIAGLSGMEFAAPMPFNDPDGTVLVRPLLRISKARLLATLKAAKVAHADDPSNRDPRFARPRWRTLMPALAQEGLTPERLARLAHRASRLEAAMDQVASAAAAALAPGEWPAGGPVTMQADAFFKLPDEVALRLLGRAIDVAGDEGPVELGKLEALLDALYRGSSSGHFRRTLAGAMLTLKGDTLTVEQAPPRRNRALKRP